MLYPIQMKVTENDYKQYLDSLDYDELSEKIMQFEKKDYPKYTDDQIAESFINTLTSNGKIIFNIFEGTIPANGWYFFRIRRIKKELVAKEEWFREPPFNPCRPNRFDFLNKSILYVSLLNGAAVIETKIKKNEPYAETVFTNKRDIKLILIGTINNPYWNEIAPSVLSKEQLRKALAIDNFICKMVTMKNNDEISAHRVAQIITKCILGKAEQYDGIMYPSVECKTPYDYNVAFFNGKETLKIEYALVYRNLLSNDMFGIWFKDGIGHYGIEDQYEVQRRQKKVIDFNKDAIKVDAEMLLKLSGSK